MQLQMLASRPRDSLVPFYAVTSPPLTCDVTASTLTRTGVQAALNAATNGQTVCLPAGSATWSDADVNVASSKGLTIRGAGTSGAGTIITINNSKRLVINTNAATATRLTNIQFLDNGGNAFEGSIVINSNANDATWRIDNCYFNGASGVGDTQITTAGPGDGLFDHNTVYQTNGGPEFFHNRQYGDASGWNVDVFPGSSNAVYFETNDFWHDSSAGCGSGIHEGSLVQNYNGSRMVFRYNTVRFYNVDIHGTPGFVGGRWFEIYENTWTIDAAPVPGQAQCINIRAGSGVIYNNNMVINGSPCAGAHNIQLIEDDTTGTWPLAYQIGSGYGGSTNAHTSCAAGTLNQSPLYLWGNDSGFGTPTGDTYVNANRDFFLTSSATQPSPMKVWQKSTDNCSTTYDYVPYVYPHPLAS